MIVERKLLIDGSLLDGDEQMEVVNPATGRSYTLVPRASLAQTDLAVAAAKRAFGPWSQTTLSHRRELVLKLLGVMEQFGEEIARSIVMEQGKPLSEAYIEVERARELTRYHCSLDMPTEVYRDDKHQKIEVVYNPLGIVVGIVPWNYPFSLGMLKMIPAVLMGNSFIWKPAPTTPVTSLLMGELIKDIFPAGVVNVISDGGELGQHLTQHPDVAAISFIGSTATGKKVLATGAPTLKRTTLELGGNDAAIVLDDVDVVQVAQELALSAFADAGQACVAVKRIYAQRGIYDELCNALVDASKAYVPGPGFENRSTIGPVQNAAQFSQAQLFLKVAHRDGKVLTGGETAEGEGFFIKPTVVRDIDHSSRLVEEEQFSPILPVVVFDTEQEALSKANDSIYGLGGSVWSSNVERAQNLASKFVTGTIWVNTHRDLPVDIPLRGAKESGIGTDYGVEGMLEYTRMSILHIRR